VPFSDFAFLSRFSCSRHCSTQSRYPVAITVIPSPLPLSRTRYRYYPEPVTVIPFPSSSSRSRHCRYSPVPVVVIIPIVVRFTSIFVVLRSPYPAIPRIFYCIRFASPIKVYLVCLISGCLLRHLKENKLLTWPTSIPDI